LTQRRRPQRPLQLEPRNSVISASGHFIFQVVGTMLAIVAVWVSIAAFLGVIGEIGSGWQGRVLGVLGLVAGVGLFLLGKKLADENRVMKRRRR